MERMSSSRASATQVFAGWRVIATEAKALAWLEEHPGEWDAVIVDLVVAEGSRIRRRGRAKHSQPLRRVCVFSSYASAGIRAHCLGLERRQYSTSPHRHNWRAGLCSRFEQSIEKASST